MKHRCVSIAVSLAAVLALSLPATGAYLDNDPGAARRDPAPEPGVVRPVPIPPPGGPISRLLLRVAVGSPYCHGGIGVFPITLSRPNRGSGIRSMDEATSRGWLTIRERDDSRVSEVLAGNESPHYVFLMTGEIILGGKQNRIIRDDVLMPPRSGLLNIAVYCGEKERWTDARRPFSGGGSLAHPGLRKSAAMRESQDAIWAEIDAQSARAKVRSPTRDYQGLYEDRALRRELDDYVKHCRRPWRGTTVGIVATGYGRILGADIFSDPDLCAKHWDKLVRAYAMDVICRSRRDVRPPSTGHVENFIRRAAEARTSERGTPGAGRLVQLSGSVEGMGLTRDGDVVHVSLFGETVVVQPPIGRPPVRPLPRR